MHGAWQSSGKLTVKHRTENYVKKNPNCASMFLEATTEIRKRPQTLILQIKDNFMI